MTQVPRRTLGPASTFTKVAEGRTTSLSEMKRLLSSMRRRTSACSRWRAGRAAAGA